MSSYAPNSNDHATRIKVTSPHPATNHRHAGACAHCTAACPAFKAVFQQPQPDPAGTRSAKFRTHEERRLTDQTLHDMTTINMERPPLMFRFCQLANGHSSVLGNLSSCSKRSASRRATFLPARALVSIVDTKLSIPAVYHKPPPEDVVSS